MKLTSTQAILKDARRRSRVGWILYFPIGFPLMMMLRWGLLYRIEDKKRWRALYREITSEGGPVMICSNHLSYPDPLLLMQTFSSHFRYFCNYRTMPWNLAAAEYSKNPFFNVVCWLFNVIYIDRGGSREHHESVHEAAAELLREGGSLIFFPEGRRSRTGRFDSTKLAYGVGKIASRLPKLTVLCVYFRAAGQKGQSGFPPFGSRFKVQVERLNFDRLTPDRETAGRVTEEIARSIQQLEARYFG